MLWSEPEPKLPNNYSSALGQLYSLEQRFRRDPNLKSLYQQSIDTDVEKGFVKILDESEVEGAFGKEWYLPHHPVLNPNKPGKVRLVCNAASKYKEVCLNDKLLAGPDLLHGLIVTIFRFREVPIALTADIESLFLQVQVPEQDRSCLRFLWHPRTNEPVHRFIWTRNGQHWDNEVEPSEEEEFLRWKEQLPIVAETSVDRKKIRQQRER